MNSNSLLPTPDDSEENLRLPMNLSSMSQQLAQQIADKCLGNKVKSSQ